MKPRCKYRDPGVPASFLCVLDDGHDGFCEPYVAPTVDEWRAKEAYADRLSRECIAALWAQVNAESLRDATARDRDHLQTLADARWATGADLSRENARLQAELDALRAIIESGAESTKSASDLLAQVMQGMYQWPNGVAWAVRESHRRLTGGPPDGVYVRGAVESEKADS